MAVPEIPSNKRILFVSQKYLIGTKGYSLFKYEFKKGRWDYFSKILDAKNAAFSKFFLTRRLFRSEITHLYHFQDDNWFCIAKKGIFKLNKKTKLFEKCCHIERGSRPMCLCQDRDGVIYYGEYFYNSNRLPISIFSSKDNGETWNVAYTFKSGEMGHIHSIQLDPYTNRLWLLTGDIDKECMIAYTNDGFNTLNIVYRGIQEFRTCNLLFYKDFIVFATDSQYEQNKIRKMDRTSSQIIDLVDIQGSGIYGSQYGSLAYISTTVEPSQVNKDKYSHLWVSTDGLEWREVAKFKKDFWNARLFQFGSIRFPHYEKGIETAPFFVDGRALRGIDGKSIQIKV